MTVIKRLLNKKNITFILMIVLILFMRFFVVLTGYVSGNSMLPTLKDGEIIIGLRHGKPQRNDIIVFDSPVKTAEVLIKRVIGIEGDKITIEKDKVYVNGQPINEDYLNQDEPYVDFTRGGRHIEMIVPKDQYYVLGDNRVISSDSRSFGAVPAQNIKGKMLFGFDLPFRFGHAQPMRSRVEKRQ